MEIEFKPKYIHDCDECIYLCTFDRHDLYYCEGTDLRKETVIARFGNDGWEYVSGISIAQNHVQSKIATPLAVAYIMSIVKGLTPIPEGDNDDPTNKK